MKFLMQPFLFIIVFSVFSCTSTTQQNEKTTQKPNVVIIYIDDLGYGDVGCYGSKTIQTPNIDKLASNGILFTNGHCSSASCTPSRFSMLTGGYAFRQAGTGIAPGDAAMIINPDTRTLPDLFSEVGYQTGVVGKWHLGLGPNGGPDWNGLITPGPQDIGFNYSFLIPATGDRVPCVFTENGKVVGLDPADPISVSFKQKVGNWPTGKENPELLRMLPSQGHNQTIINGISRIGYMTGGKSALWVDEDIADVITSKALQFIDENKNAPFFLYFSTHDIHVPRVPNPRFTGKSGMGPRGDAILEVDWSTGEIMNKLEQLGLLENTLVIFTSDNGPVLYDGYQDRAVELLGNHKAGGPLRGGKYSAFSAGTQVPFIISWPGKINPGISNSQVSQVDFMASFAKMLELTLSENDAIDSFEMLDVLLGKSDENRAHIVHQGNSTMALIQGDWKYIVPSNRPSYNKATNIETGADPKPQLYNLKTDIGETINLAEKNPEKLAELEALFEKIKTEGRTRF